MYSYIHLRRSWATNSSKIRKCITSKVHHRDSVLNYLTQIRFVSIFDITTGSPFVILDTRLADKQGQSEAAKKKVQTRNISTISIKLYA